MNLTERSKRNRKQDVYLQYVRTALPVTVFNNGLHTSGSSLQLVNTKTSFRKEHDVEWPVLKENAMRRPSLLRLDSQGESSKNDWICDSSHAKNTSSGNVQTLSLFSEVFRHYTDRHENQQMAVRYQKPKPIKPYNSGLNITSAVKLLCEKSDFQFLCHQHRALVACTDEAVTSSMHPLHHWSKFMPISTNEGTSMQYNHQKPVQMVSSLQWQPEEHQHSYCQELQYDFPSLLNVRSLIPIPLSYVVDLANCVAAFKQDQHECSVSQLPVVPFRSSDAVDDVGTLETRWMHRRSRQPRYNCRRKRLHVYHNTRCRKPIAHCSMTYPADTDGTCDSGSELPVLHSDIGSNDCSSSNHEDKIISSDSKHVVHQCFSSVHDAIIPCDENDAIWVNHCYESQLSLPSSLYNVQETHIQESCSFASYFFVSGKELDSSDVCSTDSDESDCSGFLSPSADCLLADALLSGLPCMHAPFANNWPMSISDCSTTSCYSDFEMYFEEDSTSVPDEDVVCKYSAGVHEANARWNEAYLFPADFLSETCQHHRRMV